MVLHIRAPTDGDTGVASEFLFVGGDAAAVHTQLLLLHNGAALTHGGGTVVRCTDAVMLYAPFLKIASVGLDDPLINWQYGPLPIQRASAFFASALATLRSLPQPVSLTRLYDAFQAHMATCSDAQRNVLNVAQNEWFYVEPHDGGGGADGAAGAGSTAPAAPLLAAPAAPLLAWGERLSAMRRSIAW